MIFGGRSEIGIELARLLAPGATVVLAARGADRLPDQVAAMDEAGAAKVDVREFDADDLGSHQALVSSIVALALAAIGVAGSASALQTRLART